MQSFRKAVFSAPTSFLVFASFRQTVRLACLAAASPALPAASEGAVPAGAVAAEDAVVWGIAGSRVDTNKQRPRMLAANPRRMATSSKKTWAPTGQPQRIEFADRRADEARMKLR